MKEVYGDLIELADKGEFDVIIHGCNCFCTMGKGIAKSIKHAFPLAFAVDNLTNKGDISKLGTYSSVTIETPFGELEVVNAYTQFDYRGSGVNVDYAAIELVFSKIKRDFSGKRIGYPLIGAGLARGDWEVIKDIINKQLEGEDHTLVRFSRASNSSNHSLI